ncbi:MAG TPA: MFS transporter [Chthoniobacterales bacterium]
MPTDLPVRLPRRVLIVYGLGGLAMNLTNLVVSQWLYERYVAGGVLTAATFALVLLAGRLTDGLSDPLIAFWTDNLKHPAGRRLPFLRWAPVPMALACVLLWTPPPALGLTGRTVYAFLVTQFYFLMYGILVTPYLALLPELSGSARARLDLTTSQSVAALTGTLVFALAGVIVLQGGYQALGWLLAAAVLTSFLPAAWLLREPPRLSTPASASSWKQFRRWLGEGVRNRDFHPLLAATSLFWFALNLILMLVPRLVEVRLRAPSSFVTFIMLPFIGVNLIGFFLCNLLAKRFGARRCFGWALALAAVAFPVFGVSGSGPHGLLSAQSAAALAAFPVAGFSVLPFTLLAEVIDRDAARSGAHREALYFGIQAIFQKSAIGLSVLIFAGLEVAHADLAVPALMAGLACLAAGLVYRWATPWSDSGKRRQALVTRQTRL